MDAATGVGVAASICTTLSLVPQLVKLHKERKAQNVSMGMLVILLGGLVFWITYGALQDDWIIIVSNSISLIINVSTIVLARQYSTKSTVPRVQKSRNHLRRHDP